MNSDLGATDTHQFKLNTKFYQGSLTLTASDANRLGIVQNNVPRRITPRDCARLQGYPETYKLLNDDQAVYRQMGNEVSVPVIKAVVSNFIIHNYKKKA